MSPRQNPYRAPRADGTAQGTRLTRREALAVPARYSADRKRQLVEAVRAGVVSYDEVARAHGVHADEWAEWAAGAVLVNHQGERDLRAAQTRGESRAG